MKINAISDFLLSIGGDDFLHEWKITSIDEFSQDTKYNFSLDIVPVKRSPTSVTKAAELILNHLPRRKYGIKKCLKISIVHRELKDFKIHLSLDDSASTFTATLYHPSFSILRDPDSGDLQCRHLNRSLRISPEKVQRKVHELSLALSRRLRVAQNSVIKKKYWTQLQEKLDVKTLLENPLGLSSRLVKQTP